MAYLDGGPWKGELPIISSVFYEQWLISGSRGVAVEQAVPADSLTDGEECWISNGVRGFIAAVVQLKQ